MAILKESLTFDDVTLVPQFSSILPSEASIKTSLSTRINLEIPFLSSAMDTVTESKMAIAIAKEGGLGVIHRNLSIKKQCQEVKRVKKQLVELIKKVDDKVTAIKLKESTRQLDNLQLGNFVKDSQVLNLMRYYELVKELKKCVNPNSKK